MIQGGWSFFTFTNEIQSSHPCHWGKPLDLKPNSMPTGRFTLILQKLGIGRGLRLLLSFGGKWVFHLSSLRWQWSTRRLFHLLLPQFCWDQRYIWLPVTGRGSISRGGVIMNRMEIYWMFLASGTEPLNWWLGDDISSSPIAYLR